MTIDRLIFLGFCGIFFFIPVATSPAVIIGLTTLAIWVFSGRFIKDRPIWFKQRWIIPVTIIMLLPWLGLLYTGDISTGLGFAKKSYYWLFAFAIAGLSITEYRVNTFMKAYMGGVSFTAGLFLLQLIGLIPMRPPYSVGLLNKWAHISFSLILAFSILTISFYFKETKDKITKTLYICLMLLNFLSLSLLLSDSGHLAFILLSPIIAYNLLNEKHILKILGVSILLILSLFLSPVTQDRLIEAITGTRAYITDKEISPVSGRYYMWRGALRIYLENPVFGIGTGGYQSAMRNLRLKKILQGDMPEDPIQPHNSFLYMAVSFGIPGVVAIVWLFVVLLKSGWQRRSELSGFSILAFSLVLLIGSLTDTQIVQVHFGILFSIFTGLSGTSDERL